MKASRWGMICGVSIEAALIVVGLSAMLALPALSQSSVASPEISVALSAAPASVAEGAAVGMFDIHGHFKQARAGTNGWTCLTVDEAATDKDAIERHPACYDKYGLEWIRAFNAGHVPNPKHVGYAYMLKGGSSWSNTDPKAIKPAEGEKDYIHMPPHIMILNADVANSSGFPATQVNPDTGKPFVMFGGTAYAILIIPVN